MRLALIGAVMAWIGILGAQSPAPAGQPQQPTVRRALPQVTQDYISVDAPVVVLQHVRVIDGTGAPAVDDQALLIEGPNIKAIGPNASVRVPAGARDQVSAGEMLSPTQFGLAGFFPAKGLVSMALSGRPGDCSR